MVENNVPVVIPSVLREMMDKVLPVPDNDESDDHDYLVYTQEWILAGAEEEYRKLVAREEIPEDPRVIKLLCENAVLRSLLYWYEIKNKPPPMPSIKLL